jgi:SAM-dependent methyltransferase
VTVPVPERELAERVGSLAAGEDAEAFYLDYGRRIKGDLTALVPGGWEGKRVLDFGCGAGRVLRHLVDEGAELHGCDIDRPSIEWLARHLSPPLHVFVNGEEPPLDRPDAHFDVVYAVSVFTHLTDEWAPWLLELQRLLKPGGVLVATFLGEGVSEVVTGERFDADRIGMNVINYGQSWDEGGPTVLHSPWWIRAHWGRAFEIVELRPYGFAAEHPGAGHGVVVMRKGRSTPNVADLEALEPGEPREIAALRHNIEQLHRENERARRALRDVQGSASWRLTAPLRALKGRLR